MPRNRRRKNENEHIKLLQAQILQLQQSAAPTYMPGTFKPILPRKNHGWDWNCAECGNVTYAGRAFCYRLGCNGRRDNGATCVGYVRGVHQGAQALGPIRRQSAALNTVSEYVSRAPLLTQRLAPQQSQQIQSPTVRVVQRAAPAAASQSSLGGSAAGGSGHTPPGTQTGVAKKSGSIDAATPGGQPVAAGEARVGVRASQMFSDDEAQQMEIDAAAEAEGDDPTLPEDIGPKALQQKSVNLERRREKKEKRLAAQREAIAEQHEEIARQQTRLVELQAAVDSTVEEIRTIDLTRAEVSRRVEQLNAERLNASPPSHGAQEGAAASAVKGDTATEAMECLKSAFFGLQTFKDQPLELQNILRQFVEGIDGLRGEQVQGAPPAVPPGQITLQQAFAQATGATTAEVKDTCNTLRVDIHSGTATPTDKPSPSENVPPAIPVDKVADDTMGDDVQTVDDGILVVPPSASQVPNKNNPEGSIADEEEGPVGVDRSTFLRALRNKATAQAAKASRATPYGGSFHV